MFDVFISYRHSDAAAVGALVAALREAGLAVWQDESGIEDFTSIQRSIETGLAQSRVLLAWYSARYPESLACQWELTRAFLAGQEEGDPRRRVLLVNPEPANGHIHPVELRDALYRAAPGDPAALQGAAEAVRAHVGGLPGVIGAVGTGTGPRWFGPVGGDGSNRFVGRQREMWEIHSGLWSAAVPIITDRHGRSLVRLTGMGGAGKSLTAEMYALRFAAAYPGGVFWLRATGDDMPAADLAESCTGKLADFALQLGVAAPPGARAELRQALADRLGGGGDYLWIVDDLPGNLAWGPAQGWLAPSGNGHTLITSRSQGADWAGALVRLADLDEAAALRLLTHARTPADTAELAEARQLVRDLGCHAMAVELAAAAVRTRGFGEFRASLQAPSRDALEFAARLVQSKGQNLPHRDRTQLNLSLILAQSVAAIGAADRDCLTLASVLAPARLSRELVSRSFAIADGSDPADAEDAADIAMAAVAAQSLARALPGGALLVHPLVTRAARQAGEGERAARLRLGALGALEALLGDDIFDARRHAALADDIAHARAALAGTYGDPATAVLSELRLLDALYIYDFHHGDYAEAARVAECLIAYGQARLGPDHTNTLIFMTYLGEVYRLQGRLQEAYDLHYRVLAARSQAGDPDTLISANNLALVMQAQGNLQEARDMQEMVLAQYERTVGERDRRTMLALHNLAGTLRDQGDYEGARALAERALALRREVLGPHSPETLESQLNLAEILRHLGASGEARQLNAETAAAMQGDWAGATPLSLTAQNNLAAALHSEGRFAEAREVMAEVLARRVELVGAGDPDCIASRISLAGILISLGELPAAVEQAETAVGLACASLSPGHLLIVRAVYHAVLARLKQGDPDFKAKSRELIERLAPHVDHFPPDIPDEESEMLRFLLAVAAAGGEE